MICPACNSSGYNPVDIFFVSQPRTGFFPEKFKLYSCIGCGLWFKNYVATPFDVKDYYAGLKFSESNWNYSQILPHEQKLDVILAKLPSESVVLDVGCWTGRLLSKHKHLQRFGIEPNSTSAGIAQTQGLTILGHEVGVLKKTNRTFDLITLVDVFEHLPQPVQLLDLLIRHLSPKGKLIIVTGRTDSIPIKIVKSTYWYFSKNSDHLVFLNSKFLVWLGRRYPECDIKSTPVRHYRFRSRRFVYEIFWLFSWRFLNPNSPFKKINFQKFGLFKKLENVKEITMCTNWKDHYLIKITKF